MMCPFLVLKPNIDLTLKKKFSSRPSVVNEESNLDNEWTDASY